jgi:nitroimidazol reductase NimA-like FMN-containing flavoprotein (pyridoxamine 5'-phosphate oxidase superfamily)
MAKYHFTPTEKISIDPAEIDDILSKGKYTVLALCENNEPYVVTLSYGYDREQKALYCHCARKGLKLEFIRANNTVCGTVFLDGGYIQTECGQPYRSVVYRGTVDELTALDEKKHAMSVILGHLEDDPSIIKQKSLSEDARYNAFTILRITLGEMTAKKGR